MTPRKTPSRGTLRNSQPAAKAAGSGDAQRDESLRRQEPARVSGRWLASALALALLAAVFGAWVTFGLLFWQGSWQLLYHPAAAVTRTPAGAGLAFDAVAFAPSDAGMPRLTGWWIPAPTGSALSRFTVLLLHGQTGNLGNTVDTLGSLHSAGVNVLAFDYRGYGQSQFARPSEAHWREDADWALQYLTGTRHIDPGTVVLDGVGLGANLALEVAAAHPELAGVIVESPLPHAMDLVFHDARARIVPARLLVRDRYDLAAPAAALRIPVLWIELDLRPAARIPAEAPDAYQRIGARKMLVWLRSPAGASQEVVDALTRWLDGLGAH
jgi:uncharacterized protein